MQQGLGRTGPRDARGDYELLELLPQTGGQAFVFRGVLHGERLGPGTSGMAVAVKQLIDGAIGNERTAVVGALLTNRVHPHLNRILEVFTGPAPEPEGRPGDDDALVYVASEWVPGRPLASAAAGAPLSDVLTWVAQVAGAVDFLHDSRHPGGAICHRDIKPANVIVDQDGQAVLIDPGLARSVAGGVTGSPHGSPGHIPPECIANPSATGPAGDRWQVGALLYTLLVGEAPGRIGPDEARRRLRNATTRVPTRVVDGVVEMLDPDPLRRPPTALRWALDLRTVDRPSVRRAWRLPGRRGLVRTGAVAALAVAFIAGWAVHRPSGPAAPHFVADQVALHFLPRDSRVRVADARGRDVVVYNKVTAGARGMREDDPAYLSTVADKFCAEYGCEVPGTDMHSGVELTAVCRTTGEVTTNGDDQDDVDAHNPGRDTSTAYFGIRIPGGRFGYLSVVWLAPADRNLALPACPT